VSLPPEALWEKPGPGFGARLSLEHWVGFSAPEAPVERGQRLRYLRSPS